MMIRITDLLVEKQGTAILGPLSTTLSTGSVTMILGQNGAGKTTLLHALVGVEKPTAGTIFYGSKPLSDMKLKDLAGIVAWCGDDQAIPFSFSVFDVVMMGRFPLHRGSPSAKDRDIALEKMHLTGIADLAERSVTTLSHGELRKTQIARALAQQTPVLLLDEPLANLDIAASLAICQVLRDTAKTGGTIVFSVHDLNTALHSADHVLVLKKGREAAAGTPGNVITPVLVADAFGVKAERVVAPSGRTTLVFGE